MSTHIGAKAGDIADIVLLPGDPLRAQWIAETFLENPVCYSRVRNMLGFTGSYQGQRISVQGSGMGMPSLAIYVRELIHEYQVKTIIRTGSCLAFKKDIGLMGLIAAVSAATESSLFAQDFGPFRPAPTADWRLLQTAAKTAGRLAIPLHFGPIVSTDRFYWPSLDAYQPLVAHGVLGVEMETAALYLLAARHQVAALTLLGASECLGETRELTALEREQGFVDLARLALETALAIRPGGV